jgi:hypothetical protein
MIDDFRFGNRFDIAINLENCGELSRRDGGIFEIVSAFRFPLSALICAHVSSVH